MAKGPTLSGAGVSWGEGPVALKAGKFQASEDGLVTLMTNSMTCVMLPASKEAKMVKVP